MARISKEKRLDALYAQLDSANLLVAALRTISGGHRYFSGNPNWNKRTDAEHRVKAASLIVQAKARAERWQASINTLEGPKKPAPKPGKRGYRYARRHY